MTSQEWQPIIRRMEHPNIQRNVLIHKRSLASWEAIRQQHEGNYYMTSVMRALYALAVAPGGNIGAAKTQAFGQLKFLYSIEPNGDIKIQMLHIDEKSPVGGQHAGVYRVAWEKGNGWFSEEKKHSSFKLDHQWADAHTASVVGKYANKEDAGKKIISHITKAYGAAFSEKEIEKEGNHYSLLWLNNEFKNKQDVLNLVSLIQNAQKQNAKIRWLIQGEGAGVFVNAVQFILENPTSSEIITAQKGLGNQMVYFSNPRGKNTSEKALKTLCEKAGLNYTGTNVNMKDVVGNEDARHAAFNEVLNVSAKVITGGVGGYLGFNTLEKFMESPANSLVAAVGIGVSGVILGKSTAAEVLSYAKNIPGAINTAFGRGNQNWSE